MSKQSSDLITNTNQTMGGPITEHTTYAMLEKLAMSELKNLIGRAPKSAQLMLELINRMQRGNAGVVVCSRQAMSELINASMPTVDRALKLLITEGWVQRIRIGGANALAINCQVAWTDAREDKRFAIFNATVIASRSEQDAISLAPPPIKPVPVAFQGEDVIPIGPDPAPPHEPELEGIPPTVAITGSRKLDPLKLPTPTSKK